MGRICEFREKFEDIIEEVLEQDICNIDAHELGEVVDCLKDCLEAEYYASVINAMETSDYAKELMPQSIRSKMYYKDTEEVTLNDVMKDIETLASGEDKTTIKQQLINFITTM